MIHPKSSTISLFEQVDTALQTFLANTPRLDCHGTMAIVLFEIEKWVEQRLREERKDRKTKYCSLWTVWVDMSKHYPGVGYKEHAYGRDISWPMALAIVKEFDAANEGYRVKVLPSGEHPE